MDLYLMQHGAAESADVDPRRPLTSAGRRSVARVSDQAAACGLRIDRISHSGKLRAEQSAVILAAALDVIDVAPVLGLAPNDPVADAAAAHIDIGSPESLGIVGHLPFLDRLASLLVAGDPDARVLAFVNGGLVRLVPADPPEPVGGGSGPTAGPAGAFAVSWVLAPAIAGPAA